MSLNHSNHKKEVITYYEDTGLDYGEWSKEFNMHFGYYRFPMNPFKREKQLDEMNQYVFDHLELDNNDRLVYDLGCGLAAPSRSFAKRFPDKKVIGVTLVQWQIEKANQLNQSSGLNKNIDMLLGDYTNLPFENNSADAVYALESSCHCEGLDKGAFIKEMIRVLKPGQRFVIIDGFIKKDPDSFNSLLRYCYKEICKGWALPSFPLLGAMAAAIKKEGGENVIVKDLSFHVAPTVMHAPFAVVYFLIKSLLKGEKLNRVRIGHLKACLLGLILGFHRHRFAYCMITGIKKK